MIVILGIMLLASSTVRAQNVPERKGFWANIQFGYGTLNRSSDQELLKRKDTFALAFNLGGTLNKYIRYGVELNGWLIEAFDLNDPAKGESVSQTFAIVQIYPLPARGLFIKAGVGRTSYTNMHPLGFDSSRWGQTIGVGYDIPVGKKISLTPGLGYSQGSLGSVENIVMISRHRRYSVWECGIAITYQ